MLNVFLLNIFQYNDRQLKQRQGNLSEIETNRKKMFNQI